MQLDRGMMTAASGVLVSLVLVEAGHYERAREEVYRRPEVPACHWSG